MTQRQQPARTGQGDTKHIAFDADKTPYRLNFVDVLRFIAAGSVLMQHVFENSSSNTIRGLTDFSPGVMGVVLFFLVSGYVMPLSVRRGFRPTDFFLRRVWRIYPALLVALLLWLSTGLVSAETARRLTEATVWQWVANILLIQDFVEVKAFLGVAWTLIIEFAWYGLFGATIYFAPQRGMNFLPVFGHALILLITLISLFIDHRLPLGRVGMIYAAIIGMQAYRLSAEEITIGSFTLHAGTFLFLMAFANTVAFGVFHHPAISWAQSFWPWLIAPLIFFSTLLPEVRKSRFFRSRTLAWFGSTSLSLYLLHPVAMAVLGPPPYSVLTMVEIAALTVLLSAAVFYLVERPGIEIGRRMSARMSPRIVVGAA